MPPDTGLALLTAFVLAVIGIILIVGPLPVSADYIGGFLCASAALGVLGAAFAVLRRKP